MKYTKIYIGSDNETRKIDMVKIQEVMYTAQCGYTLTQGIGYFNSLTEECAIIEIYGDFNTGIIPELKSKLVQDSIMVVEDYKQVSFK